MTTLATWKPPIAGGPTRDAVRSLQASISRTIGDVARYDSLNDHDLTIAIQAKLAAIQRLAAEVAAMAEGRPQ